MPRGQTPSRGSAQHRDRSQSASRNKKLSPCNIVKIINNTEPGSLTLRELRNSLYPNVDAKSNKHFGRLWRVLKDNEQNFIVNESEEDLTAWSGNEPIWIRTTLSLCNTHCRKGTNGRNRECDGNCGNLHVCRTFLLLSQEACPFNTRKKTCMFGHRFDTPHNLQLLTEHNLTALYEPELRKLFRRRPSRSITTFPQVCIYYNKVEGKVCSYEKCKSLHLCSDFIQKRCPGHCFRNHRLTSSQVRHVLDLFAIDQSWSDETVLEDLQRFMQSRHRNNSSNYTSDDDSYESDTSEAPDQGQRPVPSNHVSALEGSPPTRNSPVIGGEMNRAVSYSNLRTDDSSSQVPPCSGCKALEKDLKKMQINITWLMNHVTEQKKEIDELKTANQRIQGHLTALMPYPSNFYDQTLVKQSIQSWEPNSVATDKSGGSDKSFPQIYPVAGSDKLSKRGLREHVQQTNVVKEKARNNRYQTDDAEGGKVGSDNLFPSAPHSRYGITTKPIQESSESLYKSRGIPKSKVGLDSDEDTD